MGFLHGIYSISAMRAELEILRLFAVFGCAILGGLIGGAL